MHNELLHIGPFTIYGYGLMIALGVIAGYTVGEYRAKKNHMNPDYIMGFVCWTVGGGLIGAKILYYLTELPAILADPGLLLNITDGFVVYGGIIFGIFSALLYCRLRKISFFRYFDLLIPSVALGQAFGRIGCFLAGCCYGIETDSPIGIIFSNSVYAPNGVKLMPTQLISSGLDLLNFVILVLISKKKKGDGQVLGAYLVFYSIGRFFLEFLRGDLIRGSVGALSTSQFIAIFVTVAGAGLIVFRNGRYETPSENELYEAEKAESASGENAAAEENSTVEDVENDVTAEVPANDEVSEDAAATGDEAAATGDEASAEGATVDNDNTVAEGNPCE